LCPRANFSKIIEGSHLAERRTGRATKRPIMGDSIFPTLRMAFNQALGGIRLGFGRITAPARSVSPEGHDFLNRLEEVLGIELQEVEPAPQPQEPTPVPVVIVAQHLVADSVTEPAIRLQPVAQPATKAKRKRKAAEKAEPTTPTALKAATGKKRSGKSAPRANAKKKDRIRKVDCAGPGSKG